MLELNVCFHQYLSKLDTNYKPKSLIQIYLIIKLRRTFKVYTQVYKATKYSYIQVRKEYSNFLE